MNVATNLERSAMFFPDRPALSSERGELTYAELDDGLVASLPPF